MAKVVYHIQTEYDEVAFKAALTGDVLDVFHDWNKTYSWEQFLTYQVTSLFRTGATTTLYIHPWALFQEQRRSDWKTIDTDQHDAFLPKHGITVVVLLPHPETFHGTWQERTVPTIDTRHVTPALFHSEGDQYVAQWGNLTMDERVRLFTAYPLLWTREAIHTWFHSLTFLRTLWAHWLPFLSQWNAKDFMRRESFHDGALAMAEVLPLFTHSTGELWPWVSSLTLHVWAEQRRTLLISFDAFYQTVLRHSIKGRHCKTNWLYIWRQRDTWSLSELATYCDPHALLASTAGVGGLHVAHDPLWRYARHTWGSAPMTRDTWFTYLRRI